MGVSDLAPPEEPAPESGPGMKAEFQAGPEEL
jgi:hypothetical protein